MNATRWRGLILLAGVMLLTTPVLATPPQARMAVLRRGINITAWFRFPASATPAALRTYLPTGAMTALHAAGFTFVRLPVDPQFVLADPQRVVLLTEAISRLQQAGLGVVVDAHPANWHLETSGADRAALFRFWRVVAPALRPLNPQLTFPELLNEPVFPQATAQWQALQTMLLAAVRAALPLDTIVLSGTMWSSVAGLVALDPVADTNVIYTVHFYEPPELTSLAAYRPGLDRTRLAQLPFPVPADCARLATATDPDTAGLIRFYCAQHWDAAHIAAAIAPAADWARRNHTAVLLGEFGASAALAPSVRANWIRAVRTACEADGIGWALWGYDDVMGFALPRPAGGHPRLDGSLLRALGLPPGPQQPSAQSP